MLRKDREAYIKEQRSTERKIYELILSRMSDIRTLLTMCESGIPSVSMDELLVFIKYKASMFTYDVRKKKEMILEGGLDWKRRISCFDDLSMAEYFYEKLAGNDKSDEEHDDSYVSGLVDFKTRTIDVSGFYDTTHKLDLCEGECKYKTLEGLFV